MTPHLKKSLSLYCTPKIIQWSVGGGGGLALSSGLTTISDANCRTIVFKVIQNCNLFKNSVQTKMFSNLRIGFVWMCKKL